MFAILAAVACAEHDAPYTAAMPTAPAAGEFQLPRSLTPLPQPAIESRAKVELGKALVNDSRLSGDGRINCSSCHDLRAGGDDGRAHSVGIAGQSTAVNAPTVLNSELNFAQFWNGRVRTLEDQIRATVASELGLVPVAKGVETSIELASVREAGCSIVQGYLYSRPLDAAKLESLLCAGQIKITSAGGAT